MTETIRTQDVLRGFAAFLRRPELIVPIGLRGKSAWRQWAILFAMQFGVLIAVVLPLVAVWQKIFALAGPDAFEQLPKGWLVPLTVAIAPVLEELFFRGWLTGRPRALWLFLCTLAVIGLMSASAFKLTTPLVVGIGFLAILLAAIAGWVWLRKKSAAPRWYARAFPAVFYLVIAGFGLLHLSNYSTWSLLAVPLVLPQLWIGTVLGYIRMKIGLPGSILAHICSNGVVVLLAPIFG
ncbi:MAG: CPBP family glutamic-type intramembrane protease [Candidatus Andeanibacterium colombiense]|uniref:CPBP family glutamic-type intramembrane protease n=1 Tax=Candidatus Andeanibacterium colombiense TaxID=3121345 RepID=A0AAJ5X7Y2_9SPHN|nr:MAG: CPBP family glutamic-type intramembrane protease [Sphingomonadaceae bacterium]